jgi:hypothetical protein
MPTVGDRRGKAQTDQLLGREFFLELGEEIVGHGVARHAV